MLSACYFIRIVLVSAFRFRVFIHVFAVMYYFVIGNMQAINEVSVYNCLTSYRKHVLKRRSVLKVMRVWNRRQLFFWMFYVHFCAHGRLNGPSDLQS